MSIFFYSAQQAIQDQQMMEKMIGQQIPVLEKMSYCNSWSLKLENCFITL